MANVQPEFHFNRSPRSPMFDFVSADEPTHVSGPDAPTHLLLKQTTLAPGEFERSELDTVEVMGLWGSTILFARHLAPAEEFTIGESSLAAPVDFEVGAQELGAHSAKLVQLQNGTPHAMVPTGAWASVKQAAELYPMPSKATSVALLAGTVVEIEFGKLKFRIANVPAGKSTPRAGVRSAERSVLAALGLSFGTAAAVLAGLALWTPSLNGLNDSELDDDRLVTMMQYLSNNAERNSEEKQAQDQEGNKVNQPGKPADAAQGPAGAMGKPTEAVAMRRAAVKGDNPDVQLSHAAQVDAARSFGMIELLGTMGSAANAGSPFLRDPALGHDTGDFEGGMWGDPGDAFGTNGLALSGLERGGGGHGDQVAMGGDGTCLGGNCGPRGNGNGPGGFARAVGRTGPDHGTKVPIIRTPNTTVSGHLPPEVVQRIVRQNYGRFRQCYENGLRANPNLTGRVSARFVIGREGSVTNAANGGSDMPDSSVVSCVIQTFYGLSFPTPEKGIVTVTYPIMFSPG